MAKSLEIPNSLTLLSCCWSDRWKYQNHILCCLRMNQLFGNSKITECVVLVRVLFVEIPESDIVLLVQVKILEILESQIVLSAWHCSDL